ncbi:MAG TPA: glycosyltransferase, partial [Chthoniobacterales bacterium]|nr:glycosyltransferase [Chthoniobacterales bacterium]
RSFRCQIIGEGPLEADLRAQIEEMNLQDQVDLLGPKSQREIINALAAATLFVLPSVMDAQGGMDNLPSVIMEAMASGLAVVSTHIGGIPEMVVENTTGFLVASKDAAALANAIDKLIADLSLARRFGENGYKRARELFAIEKSARALLDFFARFTL